MKTPRNKTPKIGLALSGGSGKAVALIGVLEVLREHKIPIQYITACSSSTIVAASYVCGTMEQLKQDWLKADKKFLLKLFEVSQEGSRGILNIDKGAQWARRYLGDKKFEDVTPRLGFVTVDIVRGEPLLLSLGDLAKAGQASCAVPGFIEPVEWGNRLLVDGGLLSIVPTVQAKEMGADIVVGVDIAATPYMFTRKIYQLKKGVDAIKNSFPFRIYAKLHSLVEKALTKSIDIIFYNQSDIFEEANLNPGVLAILGKAIDMSQTQREKRYLANCDYLITPNVKHMGVADFENAARMLREGRRAAEAAIPEIQKVISDWQWRQKNG